VVLRRAYKPRTVQVSRVGALTVDHRARDVRVADRQVQLAAKEFEPPQTLIAEPTRVFIREELLRDVWGYRTPSRTVDSHACRLRRKLASPDQRLVINVFGVGYRLCEPRSAQGNEMSWPRTRGDVSAQSTCRPWTPSTATRSTACSLEISHAARLRQKLTDAGAEPLVQNVRGVGYRLTS
jgi:DNA-binding response OmpR family regulator